MKNINLTKEDLLRLAGSVKLRKAEKIIEEDQVKNINFDPEKRILTANVEVSNVLNHYVRIHFKDTKKFIAECSCPFKQGFMCVHTAATLLFFINQKEVQHTYQHKLQTNNIIDVNYDNSSLSDFFIVEKKNQIREGLLKFFNSPVYKYLFSKQDTIIEPKYSIKLFANVLSNQKIKISLKLVDKKGERFITNFENFFIRLYRNESIELNNIIYPLKLEFFDIKSREIFTYLREIIDSHEPFYHYKQRDISLPAFFSRRFIDFIFKYDNIYNYNNEPLFIKSHEADVIIQLETDIDNLICNFKIRTKHNELIPIEKENILFTKDKIFLRKNNKLYLLFIFDDKFVKDSIQYLILNNTIPNEVIPNFLYYILPKLEKIVKIEKPENLKNIKLIKEKPIAKLYLAYDKKNTRIVARLTFQYGKYEVTNIENPLADNRVHFKNDKDVWIVRNFEFEKQKYKSLNKWKFSKVDFDIFELKGDDRIFHFLYDVLPELKDQWEINYHKNFSELKIINYTTPKVNISLSAGINFFEVSFEIPEHNINIPIKLLTEKKDSKGYIKLENGKFIPINKKTLGIIKEITSEIEKMDNDIGLLSLSKGVYILNKLKMFQEITYQIDQRTESFFKNIHKPDDIQLSILPKKYLSKLRSYQKEGLKWIINLTSYNLGGILADDMGLGKTIQALGAILYDYYKNIKAPNLIVCPTSLLYNWKNEIEKFAKEIKYQVLDGNIFERNKKIANINNYTINITSYALLRNDFDKLQHVNFNFIILDEAQLIKNPSTRNAIATKSLNSKKRLILTGTPIENSITEMWSLFDFLMPGFLYSHKRFRKLYEKPIVIHKDKKAKQNLLTRINPFILRRLKSDVLKELPPKIEQYIKAEFSEEERAIYVEYLENAKKQVKTLIKEKGLVNSQIEILAILTKLRQICCHPALIGIDEINGAKVQSSKLELLLGLLNEAIQGNHKVLIFSQFVKMLEIIKQEIEKRNIKYEFLTGETKNRMEHVKNFNENEDIKLFLISLKAGGTGLNLSSADIVIHYDPWWNPSIEDQASDRVHRIGQKNQVVIYKLITKGSIEENIIKLQERKKELIDSIIENPEHKDTYKINEKDIEKLFDLKL